MTENLTVSSSADFRASIEATKVVEAPAVATGGPRIVVKIRRISLGAFEAMQDDKGNDKDKQTARLGLVEPRIRFDATEEGDAPLWEDLPLALRLFIAGAVMSFTTEGVAEVTRALAGASFRREELARIASGDSGEVRNQDRIASDAPVGSAPLANGAAEPLG